MNQTTTPTPATTHPYPPHPLSNTIKKQLGTIEERMEYMEHVLKNCMASFKELEIATHGTAVDIEIEDTKILQENKRLRYQLDKSCETNGVIIRRNTALACGMISDFPKLRYRIFFLEREYKTAKRCFIEEHNKKQKVQEDLDNMEKEFQAAMELKDTQIRKLELENSDLQKKADAANTAL